MVRITSNRRLMTAKTAPCTNGEDQAAVNIRRHAAAIPLPLPSKGWSYLGSKAFATRHVLASHFVGSYRTVIEIGGGQQTMDNFLCGPRDNVTVIDPFLVDRTWSETGRGLAQITHLRARFQDVEFEVVRPGEYALVMLGLELQGLEPRDHAVLFDLLNRAGVTVIEFPTSWTPSAEQFGWLCANTRCREVLHMTLNLEGNDFGDLSNSWPPRCDRELHVLAAG
jgi:hypothetical protein